MTAPVSNEESAVALIRKYVTRFVNAHDFSILPEFMADDYTLFTSGFVISGRDGNYADAVRKQMEQFPGLVFTPHTLLHVGNQIAVYFTEHGASSRDGGFRAAWPSVGIYTIRDGALASCHIEQDYFGRRRQLQTGVADSVDAPAIAPWDTQREATDNVAAAATRRWLEQSDITATKGITFDDAAFTGLTEKIIEADRVDITAVVAGGGRAAFQAVQYGRLAGDFAPELGVPSGSPAFLHCAGLIRIEAGRPTGGRVLRDRWGLYRRLSKQAQQGANGS